MNRHNEVLKLFFRLLFFSFLFIFSSSIYSEKKNQVIDVHQKKINNIFLVLKFGTVKQVGRALNAVKHLKKEEQNQYIDQFNELLSSSNIFIQRKVIEVIGNVNFNTLDNKLPPYLKSLSDDIFFTTIRSINLKKIKTAVPIIIEIIKKIDFSGINNRIPDLLEVLTSLKDRSLADFLFGKLKLTNTNTEFRHRIMIYLTSIMYKKKPMINFLRELIKDEESDNKLKGTAIYASGKMKIEEFIPILHKEFKRIEQITNIDKKRSLQNIRGNIIYALVQFEDKLAKEILFTMSRDDDVAIRLKVIHYIRDINLPELKKLLEYQSKYDPDLKVQNAAKKALADSK